MGGDARESLRLTTILKHRRHVLLTRRFWRYLDWRLCLEDNFAWLICAVVGHVAYNTSDASDPPEYACSRCHGWLSWLNPSQWLCPRHEVVYPLPGGFCGACREASGVVLKPGDVIRFQSAYMAVVCSRGCGNPRRDPEHEHPGVCVCGGYLTDEPIT